ELVAGQVSNWTDSVAYGNKKVMAVGDGGAVSVTTDGGHTWTARSFGAATNIKAVAWNKDQVFVVGGASGLLAYSPMEGPTWTVATPAASYSGTFNAVAAQGNLILAVGTLGEIQTSQNFGVISTHRTPANSYGGTFNDVTMDANGRCI